MAAAAQHTVLVPAGPPRAVRTGLGNPRAHAGQTKGRQTKGGQRKGGHTLGGQGGGAHMLGGRTHTLGGRPWVGRAHTLGGHTCTLGGCSCGILLERAPLSGARARRAVCQASAAAPAVGVPDEGATYGGAGLWAAGEYARLVTMQRGSPAGNLLLTRGSWEWSVREPQHYQLRGHMRFHNTSDRNEIFVNEVEGRVRVLGQEALRETTRCTAKIIPRHPKDDPAPRPDGYWQAYITRARQTTDIEVIVDIRSSDKSLSALKAARLDIDYVSYGPHGRLPLAQHVILPLEFPSKAQMQGVAQPQEGAQPKWREVSPGLSVLPVPTHLLCHLDNPLDVLKRYALPWMQPGDTVAVGETPVAIMQGRFRHPASLAPGLLARLCCKPFHPTSSLATACGMQALIDLVGRLRVAFAVIVAAVARLFRVRGVFYRVAGTQSRLIDDVTGTLPPYDQFITLGPLRPQETVDALKDKTGMEVAVVDVNDLRKVDILAASGGINLDKLREALTSNPAGNSDEQTPLVIVRGCKQL